MKSFRQFLLENTDSIPPDPIPHGVLIYGNKIFVGADHKKPVSISDDKLLDEIKSHGSKHGFFYEGKGGDAKQPVLGLRSVEDYKGGWDEHRAKTIKASGIQPHHFSVLYANMDVNWPMIASDFKGNTVFDGILHWTKTRSNKMFGGAEVKPEHVENFLTAASRNTGQDFLRQARTTPVSGVQKFLKKMEEIAWPKDWNTKARTAGPELLSDEESDSRNAHVIDNMGPGVYITGAGHLLQIADLLKKREETFQMHGGSAAHT